MEIGAAAGLPSGTVHPILARLETVGWLTSRREEIDPRAEGRPARRYYHLTPDGAELARAALARPTRLRPGPSGTHRWQRLRNPEGGWYRECRRFGEKMADPLPKGDGPPY